MKWIASDEYLVVFFEVNDIQLERIKDDKLWYRDELFYSECEKEKGNNAHITRITILRGKHKIFSHVKKMRNEYASVSWWSKDFRRFVICHK